MGVDIKDLVKSTKLSLEELSGRTLAIDAYNALYPFLAIIRGESGEHLMDAQGRVTSHLSGLFYRNVNLLSIGVKPIYILDGRPPSLKTAEIARRRKVKKDAVAKYVDALRRGSREEAKKYAQATSVIKDYMVEDAKKLLDSLGIPWVSAPSEGEATAAYLTAQGIASATASQDFDSLLFGASRLVRNVTISGRRKLPNRRVYVDVSPEEIVLSDLLGELGLSREQLIDVGILIGTDFNPDGFKGVGPVKALNLVREHGSLEEISQLSEELAKCDYNAIRRIFLNPSVSDSRMIEWKPIDEEGVVHFLCSERNFSENRVKKALKKVEQAKRKPAVESLERWL